MNLLNNILLNINFYDEDANQGESIFPFLVFCVHIAGIVLVIIGAANLLMVWREFNLFYDSSALNEKPDPELKKQKMKKHIIQCVVGFVMAVVAYLYLSINS